jgi:poly(A) polymerase
MSNPLVVPRAEHSLSRREVDPEALKVLYRLHQANHTAYLVGGGVRDLLLGRKPKDFDIGTSAHPQEVKKLFRNCWIIGRRFRLAHVRFGDKTVEVATFRRLVPAEDLTQADAPPSEAEEAAAPLPPDAADRPTEHLVQRDNVYGTPEEDAFRRDFTINALFYDIGTFSIIDFTGGLADLKAGVIRSIGDPMVRCQEDPVRMLRAVTLAARLNFVIDAPVEAAIAARRTDIALSAPARLIEEFYKLLRSGAAERAFRMLAERRLLEPLAPALQSHAGDGLWASLAALDAYRQRFESAPDTLTNAVILGSLLVPLGSGSRTILQPQALGENGKEPRLVLGTLPLARRDVERLRHILSFQKRLTDPTLSGRARRALVHRGPFQESLTWMELYGNMPAIVDAWRTFAKSAGPSEATEEEGAAAGDQAPPRRRRRRRRGRRGPTPPAGVPE